MQLDNQSAQISNISNEQQQSITSAGIHTLLFLALMLLNSSESSQNRQVPQRKKSSAPKPTIPSVNTYAIIRLITIVMLGCFVASLAALLFMGVSVATCLAFISLTTALIIALILLARR